MNPPAFTPETATRRPSVCQSPPTVDTMEPSQLHTTHQSTWVPRAIDDVDCDHHFTASPHIGGEDRRYSFSSTNDAGDASTARTGLPWARDCEAADVRPRPSENTGSTTSDQSDQTDDITAGSTTTTDAPTPTAHVARLRAAGGDSTASLGQATTTNANGVSSRSSTIIVVDTAPKCAFAPSPIGFDVEPPTSTGTTPQCAGQRDDHLSPDYAPVVQRHLDVSPTYGEWRVSTPPLVHQLSPSAISPVGGARPWSFSPLSTPTSHGASGFPARPTTPSNWRVETQGSPVSVSSFRHDGLGLSSPTAQQAVTASSYCAGFATSPNTQDARRGYSPVTMPSRQVSQYEAERFGEGSSSDGAFGTPQGATYAPSWGSGSCGDYAYRTGASASTGYGHHGLTAQSVQDDMQAADGSSWMAEFTPSSYGANSGNLSFHAGRHAQMSAPRSPVAKVTSPLCGSLSPCLSSALSVGPYLSSLSLGASSEFHAVPERTVTISRLDILSHCCQRILRDAASVAGSDGDDDWCFQTVALDLEGRDLGRHGSVCIITLATVDCVYLVDMVELGAAALSPGTPLRRVLEAPHITKLMYDCRADCDALYFLYNVRLAGVCDLQPAACHGLFPNSRHLPGMKDAFQRMGLLREEERGIKEAGKTLFDPKSGGSFEHWEVRPLMPLLAKYCAVDVKYFFAARAMLWSYLSAGYDVGRARIEQVCEGRFEGCCKGNALRDFA